VVVVADVEHLVTRLAVLAVPNARGSVASLMKVREFLRVQVEEVAWGFMLVTIRWFLLLEV
jgi:hypothetical protein